MRRTMTTISLSATLLLTSACLVEMGESQGELTELEAKGMAVEPIFADGDLCDLRFKGIKSKNADMYAIWNIGVNGLMDVPYPTDERPDLYGVFASVHPSLTHHVDGFDDFDHYHVTEYGPDHDDYDGTWDVYLVFPGANYDAATYTEATTVAEMQAQIDAGILGPILETTDAGFDPLAMRAQIKCQ